MQASPQQQRLPIDQIQKLLNWSLKRLCRSVVRKQAVGFCGSRADLMQECYAYYLQQLARRPDVPDRLLVANATSWAVSKIAAKSRAIEKKRDKYAPTAPRRKLHYVTDDASDAARETVHDLIQQLEPRERHVITLRLAGCTLAVAAQQIGVSRARVQQIEARAIKLMKHSARLSQNEEELCLR